MSRYTLSPRTQADIEEIWDYTEARWSRDQAEVYIRQIKAAVETLAADPRRGRTCDDVRAGYRKYPVGSHVLFYRMTPNGIDIVRILHGRMDFERHFSGE
jgi:toxin ParE1/3/4